MTMKNIRQIKDFLAIVNECEGDVWLESPKSDKFNLKSEFSQYVAMGALLSNCGDELMLFCVKKEDEAKFIKFFGENPEVL